MRNAVIEEDLKFITDCRNVPWERLEGKNILISGANGFLPSYIVETVLFLNETRFNKKATVFALVRNRERTQERFQHYAGRKDLVFIVQDVCVPVTLTESIDFIVHAASQASPKFYGKDPVGTLSANILGTHNLLTLAYEKKSEDFLFISSGEVYGEVSESTISIKEDMYGYLDPTLVRSCYAEGKRAGETLCVCWSHQYGVPTKIVRPGHTYGPGMSLDDGRVHADFVSDVIHNRNIIMKSSGSAKRTFCYLADVIVGIFTVLFKGNNAQAYNVGDKITEISIGDLAHLLVELFPEKNLRIEINEQMKPEGYLKSKTPRICLDSAKLKSLGWEQHYLLEEGFKRTVRSFL